MVAMVFCGNGFGNIEVYSPDGRCSQDLGNRPNEISNLSPAVGYINGKITMCSRYSSTVYPQNACAAYNPATSAWSIFTNVPSNHSYPPGTLRHTNLKHI